MRKIRAILLGSIATCLMACGQFDSVEGIVYGDPAMRDVSCEVYYAFDASHAYFGDYNYLFRVYVTTLEDVQAKCGPNAGACLIGPNMVIHEDTPEYICQQVLHETGHGVSWERYRDFDYDHQIYAPFYLDYVSRACAPITIEGLCL